MQDYTTIAQRIAEARRRGCKVQWTNTGNVYDPDNLPLYDPYHDADCKAHGVSIVEPEVPPTRVRCFSLATRKGIYAYTMQGEKDGVWVEWVQRKFEPTHTTMFHVVNDPDRPEITPAAALDLLKDWPEGREKLLQYFRDHPPVDECETQEILNDPDAMKMLADSERDITAGRLHSHEDVKREESEPPPLAPCPKCGGKCRLHNNDPSRVVCSVPSCNYGFGVCGGSQVRLADHPVRPDRVTEIVALFRELNERLGGK